MNLPEIQNEYPLYDLIRAIKGVDPMFASSYELYLEKKIRKRANIPTLFDLIKSFRNHIRINRAESKAPSHTAFVTLQGDPAESTTATQFSAKSTPLPTRPCLCSKIHLFSACPYIIKQIQPVG